MYISDAKEENLILIWVKMLYFMGIMRGVKSGGSRDYVCNKYSPSFFTEPRTRVGGEKWKEVLGDAE